MMQGRIVALDVGDVRIGIAVCDGSEKNYSDVFKKADTAMYRSKADLDRRIHLYE